MMARFYAPPKRAVRSWRHRAARAMEVCYAKTLRIRTE